MWEDIDPGSRDFIRDYLHQYPEVCELFTGKNANIKLTQMPDGSSPLIMIILQSIMFLMAPYCRHLLKVICKGISQNL